MAPFSPGAKAEMKTSGVSAYVTRVAVCSTTLAINTENTTDVVAQGMTDSGERSCVVIIEKPIPARTSISPELLTTKYTESTKTKTRKPIVEGYESQAANSLWVTL